MKYRYCILVLALLLLHYDSVRAQVQSAHTDFLRSEDRKFFQDVFVTAGKEQEALLQIACYRYTGTDSAKVYQHQSEQKLKKGLSRIILAFQEARGHYEVRPAFAAVIRKTGLIPPGSYRLFLTIRSDDKVYQQQFLHEQDTLLPVLSAARKEIGEVLDPAGASLFPSLQQPAAVTKVAAAIERSQFRLQRHFRKRGLQPVFSRKENKEVIDLYADDWYMGRYELESNAGLRDALNRERDAIQGNIGSLTGNTFGNYTSLVSQFKELKKNSQENKELKAELAVSANFSNDQEPFSRQDNNFYEARGTLEFPLFDIPVSVSGYYTTQDKHRQAKASYVHFRYDAEKAKEQLLKLVGSYNKRYEQTLSQGGSYDMIYGQFLQQLQGQKEQALAGLKQKADLSGMDLSSISEEQLKDAVLRKAEQGKDKVRDSLMQRVKGTGAAGTLKDKAGEAQALREKAESEYTHALEQYNRVLELERKIKKYQGLLEQYRNTMHYDSLLAYSQLKDLKNLDGASYKDIAKRASGILPESKTKSLITGLTNFDAGMFPKYVSDYTLSGQMLKGADIGYDIGFAEIGASYGKTEYIDRTGNVEAYKAYGGRIKMKPVLRQSLGFVYYGYSPGRKLLEDDHFFKDASVSLPSFRNPVHILSATYSGSISRYVDASGEYATSIKPEQSAEARAKGSFRDHSAYNLKLAGNIPATGIEMEAAYEYAGKAFENNTLAVILSGTERFRVAAKGDFLRSFLTLGVEYNYLIQNNFNSKGNNARWGFDVATHSKRFPSLALSYKPFSTFRSYNDTLSIAQKPLLGAVWTGKLSYQIKKRNKALRFNLLYNKNTSTMDTVHYGSTLVQLNTIYTRNTTMLSLGIGSTDIQTDYIVTAYPAFNQSRFLNGSAAGTLFGALTVSGGGDIATGSTGLNRYGVFLGSSYTLKWLPVMIRANFRYSNYRLDELAGWKALYSGGIELAWRFKVKLFDY
ncbi:hypothetical protein [Taibaiella helva]|uniref:hypothetical protein n=1 Tax=Taibaiella helva TaxID=2301235 RepID=UPI000E568F5C|nr:hypothetical protein [Taibaiella helva]